MKILIIDTCDKCHWRARFSDNCLHNDTFNMPLDKENPTPIPEQCPLDDARKYIKYDSPCGVD
jgi:hypothetical protein